MIKDLGLSKVIVETNCQELVELWNSKTSNRCAIIPVLNQIHETWSTMHTFCFGIAAHYTAKFALLSNSECTWLHDVPNFLSQFFQQDFPVEN